jgi:hypothetical protein
MLLPKLLPDVEREDPRSRSLPLDVDFLDDDATPPPVADEPKFPKLPKSFAPDEEEYDGPPDDDDDGANAEPVFLRVLLP